MNKKHVETLTSNSQSEGLKSSVLSADKQNLKETESKFKVLAKDTLDLIKVKIHDSVDGVRTIAEKINNKVHMLVDRHEISSSRDNLLVDLVRIRDELKWINQEAHVNKLIDGSHHVFDVLTELGVPMTIADRIKNDTILHTAIVNNNTSSNNSSTVKAQHQEVPIEKASSSRNSNSNSSRDED